MEDMQPVCMAESHHRLAAAGLDQSCKHTSVAGSSHCLVELSLLWPYLGGVICKILLRPDTAMMLWQALEVMAHSHTVVTLLTS